jgi:hypothetical protein
MKKRKIYLAALDLNQIKERNHYKKIMIHDDNKFDLMETL